MTSRPTVSVVINTFNREQQLALALEGLRWVDYAGSFEVVVVNGPSTDGTAELLAQWEGRVKSLTCDETNLSLSRNIGIAASSGDIVAFIDDDGVPESAWLKELVTGYERENVGAAGGFVFDYTGVNYQHQYLLFDRLGVVQDAFERPVEAFSFPRSAVFPHLIGTNSSFSREVLHSVGGFDEEYEYFLDEVDLIVRILDGGWDIVQVAGAHVHHKFAPSAIRGPAKIATNRYSIVKNHTYFGLRHASEYHSLNEIIDEHEAFVRDQERELRDAADAGVIPGAAVADYLEYAPRALAAGRLAAQQPARVRTEWPDPGPLLPFETVVRPDLPHGIVTSSHPATDSDRERALRAASAGQITHLLAPTDGERNIDFIDGVWVHNVPVGTDWTAASDAEAEHIGDRFSAERL